jgi:hypothetical protein
VIEAELGGRLTDFPVREILFLVCMSRRTGTLLLRNGSDQGRLEFVNGTIVRSSVSSGFTNIGNLLVRRGAITSSQLAEGLRAQREGGGRLPLGRVLIRLGHAQEPEVRSALREQVEEVAQALLSWREGEYHLLAGLPPPQDDIAQDIPDVLLAASLNIHLMVEADRLRTAARPHSVVGA